jgi:hypothetical protein
MKLELEKVPSWVATVEDWRMTRQPALAASVNLRYRLYLFTLELQPSRF